MKDLYKKLSIAAIMAVAVTALQLFPALTHAQVAAQPTTLVTPAQSAKPTVPANANALTPAQLAQARAIAGNSFAVRFSFTAEALKKIPALKNGKTALVRVREQVSGADVPFSVERTKDGFCVYAPDGITFDSEKSIGVVRAQSGLGLARLINLFKKNLSVDPIDPQDPYLACFNNVTRAFTFLASIAFDKFIIDKVFANGGATLAAMLKPVAVKPVAGRATRNKPAALYDFGDLPAPYPTTLKERGVRHRIGGVWLGGAPQASAVDAEADANRPDNDRFDDGLALARIATVPPSPDAVRVTRAPAPQGKKPLSAAFLNVLDDRNANGRWEPNEWVVQNQLVRFTTNVTQTVTLQSPSKKPVVLSRKGGVRITVSLVRLQNYRGLAPNNQPLNGGETEDYLFKNGKSFRPPGLPIIDEGGLTPPGLPTIDTGGLTPPPQTSGGTCGANQDCPSGQTCEVVNNVGTCVLPRIGSVSAGVSKDCKPGESKCLDNQRFRQCKNDGTWEVPQNCPIDTECDPATGECTQTLHAGVAR